MPKTARSSGVMIPDEEVDPVDAVIPGTTDAQAAAQSAFLGASANADPALPKMPIGMPKTVRIILEESDGMPPTGQTFSLNGRAYLIRAGEEVDIPIGLLEVIDNAVQSAPVHDPQTMKVVGYRNRHRFPYRRISS